MKRRWALGFLSILVLSFWLAALWPAVSLAEDPPVDTRVSDSMSKFKLGQMYEAAGDLTRAEDYYQQALAAWPENQQARDALQKIVTARMPAQPAEPFWLKWLSWLPGIGSTGSTSSPVLGVLGWVVTMGVLGAIFYKYGVETIRLGMARARGIPLLGLGTFTDPTGRLPGLAHQLATNMNDAGMKIYDEKGAVPPNFDFLEDSGIPQASLLVKLLDMFYTRQVQRINVAVSLDDGMLNASVSLADNANGYVRYLHVVSVDPAAYPGHGELTRIVASLVADAILISISRDPNTRGLLYQRMGDWSNALKEFLAAVDATKKKGACATYYQAHLNLGNLYSFLGLQDKSVASYTEVAEKTTNPITLTLIQAATACSYKNWQLTSPPEQQGTYEWLARQSIERAISSTIRTPLIDYTIACYCSLSGQIEQCLAWLREAVAGDLGYLEYALNDPDMENLRKWLGDRPLADALGLRVG